MEDTFWTEIADAPGEIWDMDIPELRDDEDEQTWNEFVNSNVTLWQLAQVTWLFLTDHLNS